MMDQTKVSPDAICVMAEPTRNRTGTLGSPKRTWAEKDGRNKSAIGVYHDQSRRDG
jgi:hypothetical protein